jgi:CYTH domain-containing protein
MKIVRRFLIAPALARLIRKERGSARVAEGYFPTQSGRNSHVSLEGGQCHLVLVTADPNGGPVEERTEVPRAHADALFDVCAGRAIYDRARLSISGGREAFVDRFTVPGALDLVSVEFEAPDDAASFLTPPWFGPEVTSHENFDPRHIAIGGVPPVGEVPLSNEALDGLLDALEDRLGRARYAPAPRRSAADTSVIDALRRLATPEQTAATATEAAQVDAEAAPVPHEEPAAMPLSRTNYAPRASEPGEAAGAAPLATAATEDGADARIDDVIATLSQALGTTAVEGEEPGAATPEAERPVTRLRRLGS